MEWNSPTIVEDAYGVSRFWIADDAPYEALREMRAHFLAQHENQRRHLHWLARDNRRHARMRWPSILLAWAAMWGGVWLALIEYRSRGAGLGFTYNVALTVLQAYMTRSFWRGRRVPWEQLAEARMHEALIHDMHAGMFLNALDKRIAERERHA